MADEYDDLLKRMLADGWAVSGYSVHRDASVDQTIREVLLRKGDQLWAIEIGYNRHGETFRSAINLSDEPKSPSPPVPPKSSKIWGRG